MLAGKCMKSSLEVKWSHAKTCSHYTTWFKTTAEIRSLRLGGGGAPKEVHPDSPICSDLRHAWESLFGGSKMGAWALVVSCPQLPAIVTIMRRKFLLQTGPKGHYCAQIRTIVHELQRVVLQRLAPIFSNKPTCSKLLRSNQRNPFLKWVN